jgi:hypothetical protein
MRRRVGFLFVSLLIVASALGLPAGPAFGQGSNPAIGYRILGSGSTSLHFYRFRFQPQASIPGPYAETMLISVASGTFLLYLGQNARVSLDSRGSGSGQVGTVKPTGSSGGETTFEDTPANAGPSFSCAPTCLVQMGTGGLKVAGGATLGDVAIKLTAGAAIAFVGTTPGFVCNTGDGPGRVEVAVAGLTDPQQFGWLAYATQQNTATIDANDRAQSGGGPQTMKATLLPARNPGGCAGKTG